MKKYPIEVSELPQLNDPMAIYQYVAAAQPDWKGFEMYDQVIELADDVKAKWLNITTRTLHNYRTKGAEIKNQMKEQIVMILALYRHGLQVFANQAEFEKWLQTPNVMWENQRPLDFMETKVGIDFIESRLMGLEYGEAI